MCRWYLQHQILPDLKTIKKPLSDAKWGAIKLIPYKVHAGLDVASGVLAFGAALLPKINKDKAARNTFIAMGLTGLIVGTLSLIGAKRSAS
jgi:hypothetical protein